MLDGNDPTAEAPERNPRCTRAIAVVTPSGCRREHLDATAPAVAGADGKEDVPVRFVGRNRVRSAARGRDLLHQLGVEGPAV